MAVAKRPQRIGAGQQQVDDETDHDRRQAQQRIGNHDQCASAVLTAAAKSFMPLQ
jgi:hypothetical protein